MAENGAKQVFFEYGDAGRVRAVAFTLERGGKQFAFKLPARVEKVELLLFGSNDLPPAKKEQAYRTAWENIRDWLTAQLALIATDMVRAEEVFLPYMLTPEGETYFEVLETKHFLLSDRS